MHRSLRIMASAIAFTTLGVLPVRAQATAPVVADIIKDIDEAESKLVKLAKAMPADKYAWRPSKEVRSVSEVLLHVATDNYFIPAMIGVPIDASTGIKIEDMKTLTAFEKQHLSPDATAAALTKSFAHLRKAMMATSADKLPNQVSLFGRKVTMQQLWIMTATHMHEHLGQAIAYARSNGVVPPWSK